MADSKVVGGVGALGGAVATAIIFMTMVDDKPVEITPTVETTLEAQDIVAHKDTIAAVRDTAGKILVPAKVVNVPRVVQFPMVTVPARGWIVFDADAYLPATVIITQGNVIIKKVIDPGIILVREAGGAAMNISITTIPLNGAKSRGIDSLKNEDL